MTLERKNGAHQNHGFSGQSSEPMRGFASTQAENNAGTSAFDAAAAAQRAQMEADNRKDFKSIFSQNTGGPLSRQTGAARLLDLYERTAKVLKTADGAPIILNAFKLDHQQYGVFLSSVVIAGRDRNNPEHVFVYTLLLDHDTPIEPEIRNQNGYKTVIPVVSGTAWDSKYAEVVQKMVANTLDVDPKNVLTFSACVVPKDLDISTNPNDPAAVNQNLNDLLYNAVYAINTKIQDAQGQQTFVLTSTSPNEVMTIEPRFSRNLVKDLAGREKRADIELTFSLKQQNAKSTSLNGKDTVSRIFGRMSGYIDFVSVVSENQQTGWGSANQVMQKFSPMFVVTSMFTEQAGTLQGQLAMLMAIATMANNDEWVNSLYERHLASKRAQEPIDIGEIGALNIEVNLPIYRPADAQGINTSFGPIVDTRIDGFDRAKYIQLVQQLCRQDMFIALDAPNVGAESWYMDIFRASAYNNEVGLIYQNRIWKGLQDLTNNRFGVNFQNVSNNGHLWLNEPISIHNGYYVNMAGDRRDIRDIDTLAIGNVIGPSDPTACARWAATFAPGVDTERALTERKDMIEQVCGGTHNVVYTGYSTRLLLNPAVIKALLMCASEVGFNMRFVSAYQNLGGFGQHAFNFQGATGLSSMNVQSSFRGSFGHGQAGNTVQANNFVSGLRI